MEKFSYAFGVTFGADLKRNNICDVDFQQFVKGLEQAVKGEQTELSFEEAQKIVNEYFTELQQKQAEILREAGEIFLAENAKRENVVTLPSGLQYEVIADGNGTKPTADDSVTVHYHGMLIDGTVFDSSVNRGEPATFGVTQVIQGWVEALQLMPVGSKWKLFIPSELAYGARGAGNLIAPFSTLVFEVELIDIVK